jgi:hypothetical protein
MIGAPSSGRRPDPLNRASEGRANLGALISVLKHVQNVSTRRFVARDTDDRSAKGARTPESCAQALHAVEESAGRRQPRSYRLSDGNLRHPRRICSKCVDVRGMRASFQPEEGYQSARVTGHLFWPLPVVIRGDSDALRGD